MSTPYVLDLIRRSRRSKAEIEALKEALYRIVHANRPMTVRRIFYAMTVEGLIEKTEAQYKTVCHLLMDMREKGELPWEWIADTTRFVREPCTCRGIGDFLRDGATSCRRDIWVDASCRVEIWLEKDALAGPVAQETAPYAVPLMVSRGFSSASFLHVTAQSIRGADKPTYVYEFGDHDPSGVKIPAVIRKRLKEFASEAEIHFQRVAVTPEQIEAWNLPTRPTKREGNSHAKDFVGDSVELDAIPPHVLPALVRDCIERHVDFHHLADLHARERREREWLLSMARAFDDGEGEP